MTTHDRSIEPALILFAKAPIPGRVKTRLMPDLTVQEAADVAAALIEHTVRLATTNWPGPVTLQAWPDTGHRVFQAVAARHGLSLAAQIAGDLGQKMNAALSAFTDRGAPAAVLGCDVPHCPGEVLRQAYDWLKQGQNVIGPSADGGYYLIGLQHTQPELFRDIPWGGDQVMYATLAMAEEHGLHFNRLPNLIDIDNFSDLEQAALQTPILRAWIK